MEATHLGQAKKGGRPRGAWVVQSFREKGH